MGRDGRETSRPVAVARRPLVEEDRKRQRYVVCVRLSVNDFIYTRYISSCRMSISARPAVGGCVVCVSWARRRSFQASAGSETYSEAAAHGMGLLLLHPDPACTRHS